jgi:hypothetical protein
VGGVSFVVTVCMTPVSLGRPFFQAAGYGTLLWMLLAWGTGLLGAYLNMSLVAGPLAGWATTVRAWLAYLRVPFYLMAAAAMLHAWLDIIGQTELPATPRIVVALMTAALAVYAIRLGIENTGRVIGLIAVVSILPLFLLVFALLPNIHFVRLMPFPFGTGSVPWLWPTMLFVPRGYDILPVFGPASRGDIRRPVYWGMALGGLYLVLSMVVPQLVVGLDTATMLPNPFLFSVSTITSTYLPFQRIVFLSFILWQMVVFSIVAAYSTSGLASLGVRVFPLTPWSGLLSWMAVAVGLAVVIVPEDVFGAIKNAWSIYGLILFVLVPAGLLVAGRRTARPREATA